MLSHVWAIPFRNSATNAARLERDPSISLDDKRVPFHTSRSAPADVDALAAPVEEVQLVDADRNAHRVTDAQARVGSQPHRDLGPRPVVPPSRFEHRRGGTGRRAGAVVLPRWGEDPEVGAVGLLAAVHPRAATEDVRDLG